MEIGYESPRMVPKIPNPTYEDENEGKPEEGEKEKVEDDKNE